MGNLLLVRNFFLRGESQCTENSFTWGISTNGEIDRGMGTQGKPLSWFLGGQSSSLGWVNWGTGVGGGGERLLDGRGQGSWCLVQRLDGHLLLPLGPC